MAAVAYHRATGRKAAQPNQRLGYGENFLYMLDAGAKAGCARPPAVPRRSRACRGTCGMGMMQRRLVTSSPREPWAAPAGLSLAPGPAGLSRPQLRTPRGLQLSS